MSPAPRLFLVASILALSMTGSPSRAAEAPERTPRSAVPAGPAHELPNRSLALGHFDRDGLRDLVVGRGDVGRGELVVHLGSARSDAPPWTAVQQVVALDRSPDLLAVGDLDRDGRDDVVATERDSRSWLFLRGLGGGRLGSPFVVSATGTIDGLVVGPVDLPDGDDDLVLALRSPAGPRLDVFTGHRSLLGATPERVPLPRPATDLLLADVIADPALDVVAATGSELVLAIGRLSAGPDPRRLAELPHPAADVLAGRFFTELAETRDLATRSLDGEVDLLRWDAVEAPPRIVRLGASAAGGFFRGLREGGPPSHRPAHLGGVTHPDGPLRRLALEPDIVDVQLGRFDGDGLDDLLVLPRRGAPELHGTRGAPTIVVTTTGDTHDSNTSDGVCDDGSGGCTLRAAIQTANANPGADDIGFSLAFGNWTLTVGTTLPFVTTPTTIDASTLPFGFTIDGGNLAAGGQGAGLRFSAGSEGSVVRGLSLRDFPGSGIEISAADVTVVGSSLSGNGHCCANTAGLFVRSADATIGGTTSTDRNLVGNHEYEGLEVAANAGSGNVIRGNWIGLGLTGAANPNRNGIRLGRSAAVGGSDPGAGNVVSGNDFAGIYVAAPSFVPVLLGNLVGLSPTGDSAVANGQDGIYLEGGVLVPVVGGTTSGNTLSGNGRDGLRLALNSGDDAVSSPSVVGNRIGTDPTGTVALGNADNGVRSRSASDVTFGPGNVVSGNADHGLWIDGEEFTGDIVGNVFGTSVDGTAALPNGGIGLYWTRTGLGGVAIGGPDPGEGNVFAGNLGAGIHLERLAFDEDDVTVIGNRVGVASDGSPLGNQGDGIRSLRSFLDLRGNEIAHNAGHGFSSDASTFNVRFSENSIHDNGALAIDIGDDDVPTPNDGSPDGIPTNYPVLRTLDLGPSTTVSGDLTADPSTTYRIDLFANGECDASGHGEADRLIHTLNVTTDAQGDASFDAGFVSDLAAGEVVTAQATRLGAVSRSSELSACLAVETPLFADGFESGDTTRWSSGG